MSPAPEALLSVGRDCDCGHPLIWLHGEQRCAVYGTHPPTMYMRDHSAPFASLVRLCVEASADAIQQRRAERKAAA